MDLMMAMPIVLIVLFIISAGFYGIRSSYEKSELTYSGQIVLYSDSQLIVLSIYGENAGYPQASEISSRLAEAYGLNASLSLLGNASGCKAYDVCRIVYLKGIPYLLRVSR